MLLWQRTARLTVRRTHMFDPSRTVLLALLQNHSQPKPHLAPRRSTLALSPSVSFAVAPLPPAPPLPDSTMATANGADFSTQCYRHGVLIGPHYIRSLRIRKLAARLLAAGQLGAHLSWLCLRVSPLPQATGARTSTAAI